MFERVTLRSPELVDKAAKARAAFAARTISRRSGVLRRGGAYATTDPFVAADFADDVNAHLHKRPGRFDDET